MPVLVGDLADELLDLLASPGRVAPVAELPAVRAQPIAQRPLRRRHRAMRLVAIDRQRLQRLPRTRLGHAPRLLDGGFELPAEVCRESRHADLLVRAARHEVADDLQDLR